MIDRFKELLDQNAKTPKKIFGVYDKDFDGFGSDGSRLRNENPFTIINDTIYRISPSQTFSNNLLEIGLTKGFLDTKTTSFQNTNIDISSLISIDTAYIVANTTVYSHTFTDGVSLFVTINIRVEYEDENGNFVKYEYNPFTIKADTDLNIISKNKITAFEDFSGNKFSYPSITYDGTYFYMLTNDKKVWRSTDGYSYTLFFDCSTNSNIDKEILGVFYYESILYLLADNYIFSIDPSTNSFIARYYISFNLFNDKTSSITLTPVIGFKRIVMISRAEEVYSRNEGHFLYLDYSLITNMSNFDSESFIIEITNAPYIYGNFTLEGTLPPQDFVFFDYQITSDYYTNDSFCYDVFNAVEDFRFYVPDSANINLGDLRIGVYGAKPDDYFAQSVTFSAPQEINYSFTEINTEITTAEDLFNIRYYPTGSFNIKNDIDLTGFTIPAYHPEIYFGGTTYEFETIANVETGSFIPIIDFWLNDRYGTRFNFDGEGNKISNLKIIGDSYGSLIKEFQLFDNEEFLIKNIILDNWNIQADDYVGLLGEVSFPSSNYSKLEIEDIYVYAGENFISNANYAGGIVADGNVYSNTVFKIRKSFFIGDIAAGGGVAGGIAGNINPDIKNCFVIGNVSQNQSWGWCAGICGSGGFNEIIEHCYFAGDIISTGDSASIVFDWGDTSNQVINCYYNSDLLDENSLTYSKGKARTTSEMTYPYQSNDVYIGWDFSKLPDPANYNYPSTVDFANDSTEEIINKLNDGYPALGPAGTIWIPLRPFIAIGKGFVEFSGNFFWVKKNDTWNTAEGFVKSGGSWHPITLADVKKGGSWD